MRRFQQWLRYGSIAGACLVLLSCTHNAAVARLTPKERAEFYAYNKVMTAGQRRAYLAKTTPAERATYLQTVGLAQRFEALSPLDRDAVLYGQPRTGMSVDALRFLWGEPYYTEGRRNYYEQWYYLGSSFSLASTGNNYNSGGNRVAVYIDEGTVTSWIEFIPTNTPETSGGDRQRN